MKTIYKLKIKYTDKTYYWTFDSYKKCLCKAGRVINNHQDLEIKTILIWKT